MTHETDRQDEEEEVQPYGEGLWEDVRFWFDAILSVFGDLKELMHVGATRALAVTLCNWLWGVEGALRRLILAAALRLDPATLGERPTRTTEAVKARTPGRRRPSFRMFGFIRPSKAEAPQPSAAGPARSNLPAYWHIRFPGDPLLAIGAPLKHTRLSSPRRLNPLDRRGAVSRFDPDFYLGQEIDEAEYQRRLLGLSPSSPGRPARPKHAPLPLQERPGYLRADLSDWRRVEEEWKRVIPAPHLAARIFALHRVWEHRESAIQRVARIFQRSREHLADILALSCPELAWPRQARGIYRCREVEALVPRSHAELLCLDTS